ncbi:hypothetical protein JHK84_039855 [Glycine max]|nr:hypothetical protein JHK84_039855 [Glycine max]
MPISILDFLATMTMAAALAIEITHKKGCLPFVLSLPPTTVTFTILLPRHAS